MVNLRKFLELSKETNRLLISCILLSTGSGLLLGWSWIIKCILTTGVNLKEDSFISQLWEVNPMPFYLKLYMFNWTNSEDIYKPGIKPKFQEIGPFVFSETKVKGNVTFNTNNTVSFRQYHTYIFDRERSAFDYNTNITTINPVLTSTSYQAVQQNWGFWKRKGVQITFSQLGQTLVTTKSAREFLFDGYDDILLTMASKLPFVEGLPPFDKFAWFYQRNGSSFEGDFNMGTSYENFGVLERWNFSNRTTHFQGQCGSLAGTSAGELFQSYQTKDRLISFLSSDMCRRVPLEFEEEEDVGGVRGYKYSAGPVFLDNGTLFPENKCFCPGECFPSGSVNVSSCKYGAPGFVSLPHFYAADPYYTDAVKGLIPEKDKHELFITLEPLTGIPLKVAARLQLNLLVQPVKHMALFENVPKVIFPVLWFEQTVRIPDYLLILIKLLLYLPLVFQISGALLMAVGLYLLMNIIYKQIIQSQERNPSATTVDVVGHERRKHSCTIKELQPLNHEVVVYEYDLQCADIARS